MNNDVIYGKLKNLDLKKINRMALAPMNEVGREAECAEIKKDYISISRNPTLNRINTT